MVLAYGFRAWSYPSSYGFPPCLYGCAHMKLPRNYPIHTGGLLPYLFVPYGCAYIGIAAAPHEGRRPKTVVL
eukprot:scaffold86577_cov57-Phaeocystis_antarctica.AAC.3